MNVHYRKGTEYPSALSLLILALFVYLMFGVINSQITSTERILNKMDDANLQIIYMNLILNNELLVDSYGVFSVDKLDTVMKDHNSRIDCYPNEFKGCIKFMPNVYYLKISDGEREWIFKNSDVDSKLSSKVVDIKDSSGMRSAKLEYKVVINE